MRMTGLSFLSRIQEGRCQHKDLTTADAVAAFINNSFGVEGITRRQITRDVKGGRAGMVPLPQGRPPIIPENDFALFCGALHTMSALEQAMADKRLPCMGIMSLLGTIVNGRQRTEDEADVDKISLMRRI